ncbi:MAG: alpha-amylase [Solirubrobacterales bacterium]|nr:alpha-amylase [Solirubrobacterales bacterium]
MSSTASWGSTASSPAGRSRCRGRARPHRVGDRLVWFRDAVVYQVYPRSFQDADGDGIGDLKGITARLSHIAGLGADAVWMSPTFPSPGFDWGYDVSDYRGVHPDFGTLADMDELVAVAHDLGLRVLLDLVPCHTSIEHPWFREHPDWYVWSDRDGPQNNWRATFGGPAWSKDPHGRGWYLHSFYPEQPDLDWRNPEVPRAFGDVLRFWLDRGVDGFRLDALDRLLKDPELRDDPVATAPPPLPIGNPEHAALEHVHSRDAPDIASAIASLREAAGDAYLVGEVYLPTQGLAPYLEHLDACFSFELFHAGWTAAEVRDALGQAERLGLGELAWVLSNHDFPRLPTRVGERHVRAAAMLLLLLPGAAFVYQGDELGVPDGPRPDPPLDRAGRDAYRTPMPWDDGPARGFTTGTPWLPTYAQPGVDLAAQEADPGSTLHLYRDLIALRRGLPMDLDLLEDVHPDMVAFRRGDVLVALNLGEQRVPAPAVQEVLRHTHDPERRAPVGHLGPGEGFVARAGSRAPATG